jgi:hypothetical protein
MYPDRKNFGEVFEGKASSGIPEVTLRRLTESELLKFSNQYSYDVGAGAAIMPVVGVFHGVTPIAFISFDDLFDAESGNRFHNDDVEEEPCK